MMPMLRRFASFLASPSGALMTAGFLAVTVGVTVGSAPMRAVMAGVGSILIVVGLGRRFVRAEERWRSLQSEQRTIHTDLARQRDDLAGIRRQIAEVAQDGLTQTSKSIAAAKESINDVRTKLQAEGRAREDRVVERLRNAEIRLTNTARDLEQRVVAIERRGAAAESAKGDATSTTSKNVTIGDIRLTVLSGNSDAQWYSQRGVFEERRSPLYPMIGRDGFTTFVDVGANYGFVSILAHRANPQVRIIAVEADERLIPLIKANLSWNGVSNAEVVHAVAGAKSGDSLFSLNPASTLDNRVAMDGWTETPVQQLTLDEILSDTANGPTFIKIDTQGFESDVISGASGILSQRDDWMVKMEFGPMWLRSQAVDPVKFLSSLCERFQVAESPARIPYFAGTLGSLFATPIEIGQIEKFVEYVEALNRDSRGWVDLLLRPPPRR